MGQSGARGDRILARFCFVLFCFVFVFVFALARFCDGFCDTLVVFFFICSCCRLLVLRTVNHRYHMWEV